jgi:predicted O-linked N-acetylglucosamine transferase (SPINDLY family)
MAHYDQALSLKPDYHEAWSNKGTALQELKRYDEAMAHYDQALNLKEDIDWLYGALVHAKMNICSWSGVADSCKNIVKKVLAIEKVTVPFALLALNDDASLHKKSAEIYVQDKYPFNLILGPIPARTRTSSRKIRIGYFSADFKNHPVSILTAEMFELHDKNNYEIIAFSFGPDDEGLMRLRLKQAFNQFIDVSNMPEMEIAKLSRELKIDIGVDLGGHTSDSRTAIFSYRAAPIQISYIGYLGTMGAPYIDYILADKTLIPYELQSFYSEKIAYLPSYQANDRKRITSDRIFTRQELGLPEKGIVFCCFNSNYKILPATFDGWARILNAVAGSVLFLYAENQWAETNLKKEAEARGINSAKIVFGKRMSTEEYLARYWACDLFLDTFPYNAGATASDALWSGVPVLTLMGQSFASRMAASLLNAIGLPELITNTQEEYETLAIELAMNPQRLAGIKSKLIDGRLTAPLFDTPLFVKNLESTYMRMYERDQLGIQPDHLFIP